MTDNQLSREDLKGMAPEDIIQARDEGRLDHAMGVPVGDSAAIRKWTTTGERLTLEDVRHLSSLGRYEDISAAAHEGRVDGYGTASESG